MNVKIMILAKEYETEDGIYYKGTGIHITDSEKHQEAETQGLIEYCTPAQKDLF